MSRETYEDGLQFAVAEWLDLQGWLWTHFPAGEYRPVKVGAKLKRMGLKRGVPDCLIFEPWGYDGQVYSGFGVVLELKSPKGKPTKEQREWLAALKERGWATFVCRTTSEAMEACKIIG